MSLSIPVIDFENCGLGKKDLNKNDKIKVGKELKEAFQTIGFCYLKNHGVNQQLLDDFLGTWRSFFEQPVSMKQPFAVRDLEIGWTSMEQEKSNPSRPGDLKEAFNYHPEFNGDVWPNNIEGSRKLSEALFSSFQELAKRVFDVLSVGLQLEDESVLRDCYKLMGRRGNWTSLRTLYYPPVDPNSAIKPGQIRLGEHSDYGLLTLLHQDDVGGLEVQTTAGQYIPATPIPGTILINIGDLMQRWTSDSLLATKHRVLIQSREVKERRCRQSIAFFVMPDNDFIIRCLDGGNKYEEVRTGDYLEYKFNTTYK